MFEKSPIQDENRGARLDRLAFLNKNFLHLPGLFRGNIHLNRGCYDEASCHFDECLQLCREMGHEKGIAVASFNLGEISKEQGNTQRAEELFQQAISYARQQSRYLLCQFLAGYADLRLRQQRLTEALESSREAQAIAQELHLTDVVWTSRLLQARIAAAVDRPAGLVQMERLLNEPSDDPAAAEVHYWLFQNGGGETHRQAALEIYRSLDTDPENRVVKRKIAELETAI